ncbi:MAG: hypothetical protein Q9162_005605 [Coniocarpon cinnabarinum]
MSPTKVKTGSSKGNNKRSTKPASRGSSSKNKKQSSKHQAATSSKVTKQKPGASSSQRKRRKEYDEKDLNIPQLNMITPVGVQKPKGKKKGKVFVDDQESMMTILAMVNADKEGQIESKMIRARQMEEIRQARQKEMEARADEKQKTLEKTKDSLRRNKKKDQAEPKSLTQATSSASKPRKKVSFG